MKTSSFSALRLIKESWINSYGIKGKIWCVLIACLIINLILWNVVHHLGYSPLAMPYWLHFYVLPLIIAILFAPLVTGCMMVSIRHTRSEKMKLFAGFGYYRHWIKLTIALFLISVIADLGWNFFALFHTTPLALSKPDFYTIGASIWMILVIIFTSLMLALVADQHFSISQAFKASCKLTAPVWGKIFALLVLMYLLLMILLMLVFYGSQNLGNLHSIYLLFGIIYAVWVLPFMFNLYAGVYTALVDSKLSQA